MKRTIISSLFTLLILICSPAMSEIYTWIDESGKKHFGDKIPERFQDQGSEYAVSKTNSSQSVKVVKKPVQATSPLADVYTRDSKSNYILDSDTPEPAKLDCKALNQQYQEAKLCYAACRSANGGKIGPGCQRCTNAKKPKC
ncbi:MAG: DUF4124 domain-containing protein [Halioglobus sp.]